MAGPLCGQSCWYFIAPESIHVTCKLYINIHLHNARCHILWPTRRKAINFYSSCKSARYRAISTADVRISPLCNRLPFFRNQSLEWGKCIAFLHISMFTFPFPVPFSFISLIPIFIFLVLLFLVLFQSLLSFSIRFRFI
jgi:hypothetical protein